MALDSEYKKLLAGDAWAETGDRSTPEDTSITPVLSRTIGFPASYSTTQTPARTRINQILRELYGAAKETIYGVSGYDAQVEYPVNAIVQHGGELWRADVKHDPTSPVAPAASGQSNWTGLTGTAAVPTGVPATMSGSNILIEAENASQFRVYWFAPDDNGSDITSYSMRYSTNANMTGATTISNYTQGTPVVLTGANAGRSNLYYVQVRATNGEGTGAWPSGNGKQVRTTPLNPEPIPYFSITPASTQVDINWGEPELNGLVLHSTQSYIVQWKSDGQSYSSTRQRAFTGTVATIQNLLNDRAYTFRVTAQSTQSTINYGNFEATSTPTGGVVAVAPSKPTGLTVVPGRTNGSLFASLANTPDDNGSKITNYSWQFRTSAEGNTPAGSWITHTSSVPFIEVTGLTDGNWDVQVRARNAGGNSPYSDVAKADPFLPSVPSTPTVRAEPSTTPATGGGVIAYITNDIEENGATLTKIDWRWKQTSDSTWTTISNSELNYVFNLNSVAGRSLDFQARAANSAGNGAWSSTATVTAPASFQVSVAVPDAPVIAVNTIPGNGRAIITLNEITDDNNDDITSYIWQSKLSTQGSGSWANITPANADVNRPYYLTENQEFTAGSTYNLRAYAVNGQGTSAVSNVIDYTAIDASLPTSTYPDAPGLLFLYIPSATANRVDLLALLSGIPDDNGADITGFDFNIRRTGTSTWTSGPSTTRPWFRFTNLLLNTSYQIRARAINSVGSGNYTTSSYTTPSSVPIQPSLPTLNFFTARQLNPELARPDIFVGLNGDSQYNSNGSDITQVMTQIRYPNSSSQAWGTLSSGTAYMSVVDVRGIGGMPTIGTAGNLSGIGVRCRIRNSIGWSSYYSYTISMRY